MYTIKQIENMNWKRVAAIWLDEIAPGALELLKSWRGKVREKGVIFAAEQSMRETIIEGTNTIVDSSKIIHPCPFCIKAGNLHPYAFRTPNCYECKAKPICCPTKSVIVELAIGTNYHQALLTKVYGLYDEPANEYRDFIELAEKFFQNEFTITIGNWKEDKIDEL